jgi:hypothetical protein
VGRSNPQPAGSHGETLFGRATGLDRDPLIPESLLELGINERRLCPLQKILRPTPEDSINRGFAEASSAVSAAWLSSLLALGRPFAD